jgi:putative endonuclease
MTFLRRRHHHPQRTGHQPPRTPQQRSGDHAEEAACATLAAGGCRVIARNVRFREGELDIVAEDGDTLVFVEVRMRNESSFGSAEDTIDAAKRNRLIRAAQHFLNERYNASSSQMPACRFDVITASPEGVKDWIRDAFTADVA